MKWEKKEIEEIKEVLESLNKLKAIAKDKLNSTKEKLEVITNEIPEYAEIYKKMKDL